MVNIWSGIGVLIFSTLLSVVIVYNFAPSAGVDFTIGENSLAGFWALYLEALFLLATREALVSKDRSLEVIIDKAGSLLLDQATLALRKVNFKFTGDNPAPPTLMFGKAEGSFAFNIKLGGWVFVTQFSRHKVISNGQES